MQTFLTGIFAGHLLKQPQGFENGSSFLCVEFQKLCLEHRVVEIELNHRLLRCSSIASSSVSDGRSSMLDASLLRPCRDWLHYRVRAARVLNQRWFGSL